MSKDKKMGFYLWDCKQTPLTKEETITLFREYRKSGDEKTREKLIYRNSCLVRKYFLRYGYSYVGVQDQINPSEEDIKSIGLEELVKAVDTFDPDEYNFAFSTYVFRKINQRLYGELIKYRHSLVADSSLDEPLKGIKGEESSLIGELVADNSQNIDILHDKLELKFIQENILPLLSKKERRIFEEFYYNQKKLHVIAEEFGLSRESIRRQLDEVTAKVKNMYMNGVSEFDRLSKGVEQSDDAKKIMQENQKLFQKYGRRFLKQYFLPLLKPTQQKIFNMTVLNYRGQTLFQILQEAGVVNGAIYERILNKLNNLGPQLKYKQEIGELPKEWTPTLLQQQKINKNERLLEKYGGKFFLQKYFVPVLSDVEKKVFTYGFLEFDGETHTELAEKIGITDEQYLLCYKKVLEKLKDTDFEIVVDLIDNKSSYKRLGRGFNTAEEKQFDLEALKKRSKLVEDFGGRAMLQKYFLPILPQTQRDVFELLYVKQTFTTYAAVAQALGKNIQNVIIAEKTALGKLKETNLQELQKIEEIAEEYLDNVQGQTISQIRGEKRTEIIRNFGGIDFIRERFLPYLQTKLDRDVVEEYILNGKTANSCEYLFQTPKRNIEFSYTKERVKSYTMVRMQKYILPQLEEMKNKMPDFEQQVRDFYLKKGFEKIHPDDFEKMTFKELELISSADAKKREEKKYIEDKLVERAGGIGIVLRDFRPTLKTATEQFVFLRTIQNFSNAQIAKELQISAGEISIIKQNLKSKLESFADEREKRLEENKKLNRGGKRVKGQKAPKSTDDGEGKK